MLISVRRAMQRTCPNYLWKFVFLIFAIHITILCVFVAHAVNIAALHGTAGMPAGSFGLLSNVLSSTADVSLLQMALQSGESAAVFFPMGLLLPVVFQRISERRTMILVFLTSAAVELVRFSFISGTVSPGAVLFALIGGGTGTAVYQRLTRRYPEENAFLMSVISVLCLFAGLSLFGWLFTLLWS